MTILQRESMKRGICKDNRWKDTGSDSTFSRREQWYLYAFALPFACYICPFRVCGLHRLWHRGDTGCIQGQILCIGNTVKSSRSSEGEAAVLECGINKLRTWSRQVAKQRAAKGRTPDTQ